MVLVDLALERRPRTDQAHLAADHVHELRQLIEAESPEQLSDAGGPRILADLEEWTVGLVQVLDRVPHPVRPRDHGAELEHLERPEISSHPLLPEHDGTGRT